MAQRRRVRRNVKRNVRNVRRMTTPPRDSRGRFRRPKRRKR